ncbi:MAG: DUF4199 domain-containing protein [Ignavibacteria bacterium]
MKTEIKYGLITGIAVCIWILLEFILGFHNEKLEIGKYSGYFATIIPIITLYLTIKEKRDMHLNGFLTLGQGIKTGLIVSLISAVITTLFFMIYNNYINPGWMELAMEWEKSQMMQSGASQTEIAEKIKQYETMYSPTNQLLFGFLATVAVGFILSLIISLILKKKSNIKNEN